MSSRDTLLPGRLAWYAMASVTRSEKVVNATGGRRVKRSPRIVKPQGTVRKLRGSSGNGCSGRHPGSASRGMVRVPGAGPLPSGDRHPPGQGGMGRFKAEHPDGIRYSRFCERYRAFRQRLDVVMRQSHRAGDERGRRHSLGIHAFPRREGKMHGRCVIQYADGGGYEGGVPRRRGARARHLGRPRWPALRGRVPPTGSRTGTGWERRRTAGATKANGAKGSRTGRA